MISAKFLFAAPPPAETVIPAGFRITKCATRVASGARKPMNGHGGGAATTGHAIEQHSRNAGLLHYAAAAKLNRR